MFYLYGTTYCHLCDQAQSILNEYTLIKSITWQVIDIVDDEKLMVEYGHKIPVLKASSTKRELSWPFDLTKVESFIINNM